MRAWLIPIALILTSCGGDGGGPMCGATTCDSDQVCCVDCDGNSGCATACSGEACIDSGAEMDSGPAALDSGAGSDSGTSTDAGDATDSGTATDSGPGSDGGAEPCDNGTCRLSDEGACEAPTGSTGNGCCECTNGTCTNFCRCLAADTLIATVDGERPVSELAVGDLVYSVHDGATVLVPIGRTNRSPVSDHVVVRVRLANGSTLNVSPVHPTAAGGRFGDLVAGGTLDGVEILSADLVPYEGSFTHDILPMSNTGTYYAGGVLVGSTLLGD